jgi:signal transduction histidine kinase
VYKFLSNNRDELIQRCKDKVAERPKRSATPKQLENGVPLFLEQLVRTLKAEERGGDGAGAAISGASGGDQANLSQMGEAATQHGKTLNELGYTIDQVVHDYGDLCQAITDLAVERDAPFSIDEFRTLNRCLDNAIADAVTAFSGEREAGLHEQHSEEANERLGYLVHELRNAAGTASLAYVALRRGGMSISGATGDALKRSLDTLNTLIDHALTEVRLGATAAKAETFSVADFMEDARRTAELDLPHSRCKLAVSVVDPSLQVTGNRDLLLAALANLLQNAFKFTHDHSTVILRAYADKDRVLFDVEDECGGLPPGNAESMFSPFHQRSSDKTGLGLGLTIARKSVEADGGILSVRNLLGKGCVFTISLPRRGAPEAALPVPASRHTE